MDRQLPSLPPLRDMVDMSQPRGTPPALNASWTAVNHRPEGPVSPRTQPASLEVNARPTSPSHHRNRSETRTIPQEMTSANPSSTERTHAALSFDSHPLRFTSGDYQIVGKPITARQDSAVFTSVTSQSPTASAPSKVTSSSGRSPEIYQRTTRNTATHPLTPPSDSPSLQPYPGSATTHPPLHERFQTVPSSKAHQPSAHMNSKRHRERSHSDVTARAVLPLPQAALFNETKNMPPPPVPAPSSTSEPLTTDACVSNLISSHPQHPQRHSDDVPSDEEGSVVKCTYCLEIWTYPPLDVRGFGVLEPTRTLQDMEQKMDALTTLTSNYQVQKEADYRKWMQLHASGHCNCTDHQSGSKRKLEGYGEETTPPSKLRKRSSESPSRSSAHLTPPPDQVSNETALYLEPEKGTRIPLDRTVARVIGPYIRPADDSNNMFYDAHGERKRVKTEEAAH